MSTIFPGNYVSHLNAYREQGVLALPGVEFYRAVGALVLDPDTAGNLDASGILAAGTYNLKVLSPDLRQDDKARTDKNLVVPGGAVVYKTAISVVNVCATGPGKTVAIAGLSSANSPIATALGGNGADYSYDAAGSVSTLNSILNGTANSSSDATVQITTSGANKVKVSSGDNYGAGRTAPAAIIVEVCYYKSAAAPDIEDLHIPYGVEAGQGT